MSVSEFGVTHDTVRKHYFPTLTPFTANSSPSSTTAAEKVSWAASRLAGQLRMKSVTPSSITDAASEAYFWCAETLSLMVALDLLPAMSGNWSKAADAWQERLKERLEALTTYGVQALGDGAVSSTANATGPSSHISTLSLDVGDTSLASSVGPKLRRDDEL